MSEPERCISRSLEDYLETIYRLLGDESVARVGDIATEMSVSPASVSPAMKRLSGMGLVDYSKRRHVRLTEKGMSIARKTLVRHNVLSRFLVEILGMDEEQADGDACAMEHSLSDDALLRLATMFEFMAACPGFEHLVRSGLDLWESGEPQRFRDPEATTPRRCPYIDSDKYTMGADLIRLTDQTAGEPCRVGKVTGTEEERTLLVDLGFIEGSVLVLLRPATGQLPSVIELDGYRLEVGRNLTSCIMVRPGTAAGGSS